MDAETDLRGTGALERARGTTPRHDAAQRRQITVMFCDLVGSTPLAGRLDPEDFREVLGLYQELAAGAIERYNGFVAQFLGDGVVACFGYPRAHEDDAHRALYAGLAILDELESLNPRLRTRFDATLQVRIGCHTGLVVAGAMEGAARREAFEMVGETPHIAARLQGVATPGSLVVSEATAVLIRGFFETEPLGERTLAGVSRPIRVHRVIRPTRAEDRLDPAASELTPLVGRTVEMEMLLAAWHGVQQGRGTLVQVSGEPGIGKSRLVRALAERLTDELAGAQRWQASRHHQSTALYPVTRLVESRYELERDDAEGRQLEKLREAVAGAGLDPEEVIPLLADLLSVGGGRTERSGAADAQETRTTLLRALQALLVADPAQHPMLLVVEDLQWADPTTLELLWRILNDLSNLPVLCVLTHRQEFAWPWRRQPGMQIELGPLGPDHVRELARTVSDAPLDDAVMGRVFETAGGIPLFVEEMLKMLALADSDHDPSSGPTAAGVPTTLDGLLTERLDRLSELDEVLDMVAVLGREFDAGLLAALEPLGGADVNPALTKLVAHDILQRLDGPQPAFEFKHALLQEAAYSRVLRRRRQQLHARVAGTLVKMFPERAERDPELVAHHFSCAGLPAEASRYWRAAGMRSLESAAFVEAAEHFRRGLEMLEAAEPEADTEDRRADFLTHLGAALQAGHGYAAAGVDGAYAKARVRWQATGDYQRLLGAVRGQSMFHLVAADFESTYELAGEMLGLASKTGSDSALAEGHLYAGLVHLYRAELELAAEHLEKSISAYRPQDRVDQVYEALGSTGAGAHAYLANVLSNMGREAEARSHSDQSLELAERVDRPVTRAQAWFMRSLFHLGRGEPREFAEWVEKARAYSVDRNIRYWRALASAYSNWGRGRAGDPDGIARLQDTIDSYVESGARLGLVHLYLLLADVQMASGAPSGALAAIARAEDHMSRSGERLVEADLLRSKARVLMAGSQPDPAAALAELERATDVAERQGARVPQLRALRALVALRRSAGEQSRPQEERLAELCQSFASDSQLPDLQRAREVLRSAESSG